MNKFTHNLLFHGFHSLLYSHILLSSSTLKLLYVCISSAILQLLPVRRPFGRSLLSHNNNENKPEKLTRKKKREANYLCYFCDSPIEYPVTFIVPSSTSQWEPYLGCIRSLILIYTAKYFYKTFKSFVWNCSVGQPRK